MKRQHQQWTIASLFVALIGCGDTTDLEEPGAAAASQQVLSEDGQPIRDSKSDNTNTSDYRPGAIDGYNQPGEIDKTYERAFSRLPLSGTVDKQPWTGSYWPRNKGGISYRWMVDQSHTYESPTRDEVLQMSREELAALSPAEKYDLLTGSYDYPLTLRIKAGNQPGEASWTGYCHGWTQAAIHFEEPEPVVATTPDGVQIPFGSSDIKALLTYYQGDVVTTRLSMYEAPYQQVVTSIGTMCSSGDVRDAACWDTNPGAFHIVMANEVGVRKQAFGIDATTTYEKWNHPVHTYETQEITRRAPHKDASPEAVEEIVVKSRVTYTVEIEPQWDVAGEMASAQKTKEYTYTLELDASGQIVGGQWVLLLEGGAVMTFHEAVDYFKTLDENGDGNPDLKQAQINQSMWQYFDFPDYVWVQGKAEFGQEFKPAYSGYSFVGTTRTTRAHLHQYMALVPTLLR